MQPKSITEDYQLQDNLCHLRLVTSTFIYQYQVPDNLTRATKEDNWLKQDYSSVQIFGRISKIPFKPLFPLFFELLAIFCPKVEYDFTNHSETVWGLLRHETLLRKIQLGWSLQQMKYFDKNFHIYSFKSSGKPHWLVVSWAFLG